MKRDVEKLIEAEEVHIIQLKSQLATCHPSLEPTILRKIAAAKANLKAYRAPVERAKRTFFSLKAMQIREALSAFVTGRKARKVKEATRNRPAITRENRPVVLPKPTNPLFVVKKAGKRLGVRPSRTVKKPEHARRVINKFLSNKRSERVQQRRHMKAGGIIKEAAP